MSRERTSLRWQAASVAAFIVLAASPALAVQRVSVRSGDWTTKSTWFPFGMPKTGDTITVWATHTVRFTSNGATVSRLTIQAGGTLVGARDAPLTVNHELRNDGTLWWPKGNTVSAGNVVNYGVIDSMASATLFVPAGSGGLVNNGTMRLDGGAVNIVGARGIENYATIALGNGSLTLTAARDFTNDGTVSSTTGSMDFTAGIVNRGTLASSAGTITIGGSLTSIGIATFGPGSHLVMEGPGHTSISSTTPLVLGRLTVSRDAQSDTVTLNTGLTMAYAGTAEPALSLARGTLVTNGQNLTVAAAEGSETRGTGEARLAVTGIGTVRLSYLNQSGTSAFGLRVSGSPTVEIRRHELGGAARCEVAGGTVGYTGTGNSLALGASSSAGGWYATGGTVTFAGSITATSGTIFQAGGTARIRFVGSTNATVSLHNSTLPVTSTWEFNELRVEKAGAAGVTFSSGTGALGNPVTAAAGLAVTGGALTLGGTFAAGKGYVLGNVVNDGAVSQAADIYASGNWTGTGTFTHGGRKVTFNGAGTNSFVPGSGRYYDVTVDKAGGSLALAGNLEVERNLVVSAGAFALGERTLTLGTSSSAGSVDVNAGTFSVAAGGTVTAASAVLPYRFDVKSGATIAARHATFRYMNGSGLAVAAGALVSAADNFSNCTFEHGGVSGPMLKIENDQILNMTNVSFSGTAGYNIEKLGATGRITVTYGSGNRWGAAYENDPAGRVDWVSPVRHDVGVTAVLVPADTVGQYDVVWPKLLVRNFGGGVESFNVRVIIDDGTDGPVFNATQPVAALAVGETRTVEFAGSSWVATPQRRYRVTARTELAGDDDPTNDAREQDLVVTVEKPASFGLVSPPDQGQDRPAYDALVWQAATRATGYDVYLDTLDPPAGLVSLNQTATSFDYLGLESGREYRWMIAARNAGGRTPSAVRRFTIMAAPGMPQLSSPMNGASDQPLAGVLTWAGSAGATGYDVYLDTENPPVEKVSANQEELTYAYGNLTNDRTYYWQVAARNAGGETRSGVWSFTTVVARPGPFALSTPADLATGVPLAGNLTWRPSARATGYDVYLDNYTSPVTRVGWDVAETLYSYAPFVDSDRRYYWRVVAKNPGGQALCSRSFSFTTEPAVVIPDVGATAILSPAGIIDTGATLPVRAVVRNFGTLPATFRAFFRISDGIDRVVYGESTTVSGLDAGGSTPVSFPGWPKPYAPGGYTARCSTWVAGDGNPGNDVAAGAFTVILPLEQDAGLVRVSAPAGAVDTGSTIAPRAVVRNSGTLPASFRVFFRVDDVTDGPVYCESTAVSDLAAGATALARFPEWPRPREAGLYVARCSTALAADGNPTNDTVAAEFEISSSLEHDVGVLAVVEPAGMLLEGANVVPAVRLANHRPDDAACDVRLLLLDRWGNTVHEACEGDVFIPGCDSLVCRLAGEWAAAPAGEYTVVAHTIIAGDGNPANDTTRSTFRVLARGNWAETNPIPAAPSDKPVKDGAWLATGLTAHGLRLAAGSPESEAVSGKLSAVGCLYVAKGNKTTDFYRYDPADDTFHVLESIPSNEGGRRKPPSKGSAATYGDGFVYMTRGGNTSGFWCYDVGADSWSRLPDVPLGPDNKKVKGGTDMVYAKKQHDTGYVYLLKGYKTEFYRYNVEAKRWDILPDAPCVAAPKYDKGSFLAHRKKGQDVSDIYCHQAKYVDMATGYHYMFRFDVLAGRWTDTLKGMPLLGWHGGRPGKSKKSGDGAGGAWYGDNMYVLKGGNTQQFFRYFPEGDSWQELDTLPGYGSTGKKKYVKAGGDIAACEDLALFTLKGNKTFEMWRYTVPTLRVSSRTPQAASGAMSERTAGGEWRVAIAPNPFSSGFATVRLSLPKGGPVAVTVFDIAGRCVFARSFVVHTSSFALPLDCRRLSSGVYLVRLDAGNHTATQKLVVQR